MEAVMRVLHVAAGIEVEPQKKIYDSFGCFVARADLWLVGTQRIHEYDGDVHRERQVHRNDLTRDRRLIEIASIIASADRLLGRSWDRKRLARWEVLLDDSLFRPAGRSRAMSRWQRAM